MQPRVLLVVVAAMLLLAGCPAPDDDDPCSCPNLTAVVTSIDWAGDGATRIDVYDTLEGPAGFPRRVTGLLTVTDSTATLKLLGERLSVSGVGFVASDAFNRAYRGNGWQVAIGVGDSAELIIHVDLAADDSEAAQTLQVVVDALGTLP